MLTFQANGPVPMLVVDVCGAQALDDAAVVSQARLHVPKALQKAHLLAVGWVCRLPVPAPEPLPDEERQLAGVHTVSVQTTPDAKVFFPLSTP